MSKLDASVLEKKTANFLDNLSDELLLEILRRLLPDRRSAIRCSAVSKRWYSLISNQYSRFLNSMPYTLLFQFMNHKKLKKKFKKMFKKKKKWSLDFETYQVFCEESKYLHMSLGCNYLSFLPKIEPFVRATYEDLLLVSRTSCLATKYYICNPLTRKYVELPRIALEKEVSRLGLICKTDIEENKHIYRVVHISDKSEYQLFADIFCSETQNWSRFSVKSPKPLNPNFGVSRTVGVVACNGMLHWVDGYDYVRGIVAFDPFDNSSEPKQCLYIDSPAVRMRNICLGSCKGWLRVAHFVPTGYSNILRVWELMDYGDNSASSWCLKHQVCFERMEKVAAVLAFHPNNGDVIFFFYDNCIFEFDLLLSKQKKVGQFPVQIEKFDNPVFSAFSLVHPFWPTRVPSFP